MRWGGSLDFNRKLYLWLSSVSSKRRENFFSVFSDLFLQSNIYNNF